MTKLAKFSDAVVKRFVSTLATCGFFQKTLLINRFAFVLVFCKSFRSFSSCL